MAKRNYTWLLAAPLLLAFGAAWAQDEGNGEDETEVAGLPGPAADEARDASGITDNESAQFGLGVANEATMRVIDDAEGGRPDAVTENIPIPAAAEEDRGAIERAEAGRESAGDQGVAAIEDAKGVAAEQAQDALNAAQEAIEQRGRGNPPEDLPANPEIPDVPEPPVNPTGG